MLDVLGNQTVFPIFVARIETPQDEYFAVSPEDEIGGDPKV